jgi:hypothetical protein
VTQHPGTRRRMPKRSKEETRALMLRAAVDLLRERALSQGDDVVSAAMAHIRIADIAARATDLVRAELGSADDARAGGTSITTGAVYQIWPRQSDLQSDLLFHIAELQAVLVPGAAETVHRFADAARSGTRLEDVLRSTAEEIWRVYRDDPMVRIELSFLIAAVDPRVRAALAHRRERFSASADQVWQGLLDAYGLQIRAPYRLRDLTTAIAAQIVGSVVLWWADPHVLADPFEGRLSLTAHSVTTLVRELTEPATMPDPAKHALPRPPAEPGNRPTLIEDEATNGNGQ